MTTLATRAAYARHRKVSRATVHDWEQRGHLVMSGNAVDVEATDKVLDARPDCYRGGRTTRPAGNGAAAGAVSDREWSHAEAVRLKECSLAQLRALEYDVKRGELVRTEDLQPVWARIMLAIRSAVLAIPSTAKLRLQLSDAQTHELMEIVREALTKASTPPLVEDVDDE